MLFSFFDNNIFRWRIDFILINNCIVFYLDNDIEVYVLWVFGLNKVLM